MRNLSIEFDEADNAMPLLKWASSNPLEIINAWIKNLIDTTGPSQLVKINVTLNRISK